jgi:hypothetical protein
MVEQNASGQPDEAETRELATLWREMFFSTPTKDPVLQTVVEVFAGFVIRMDRDPYIPLSPLLIEAYRKLLGPRDLVFTATQEKRQRDDG